MATVAVAVAVVSLAVGLGSLPAVLDPEADTATSRTTKV